MPNRVFETRERTVMEERRLQHRVSERRCAEPVAISRIAVDLLEPEIALSYRLDNRVSLEADWMHISQGRLFNREQNPGIDMVGARLNYRL